MGAFVVMQGVVFAYAGLIAPALVMGWFCCRGRIAAIQAGLAGPAAPADDRGEGTA